MSSNRKRLSLFAGSSLVLAGLIAGAGLVLAPASALAADECGNPDANTTGSDTFVCSGPFASIVYPDTNGTLTLNLANDLAVSTGGLSVTGTLANNVSIGRSNTGAATLDPTVTSTSGPGVSVVNATGSVTVNLTDPAFTDGPGVDVTGTTHGVRLQTASTSSSAISFTMNNGSVEATGASGIGLSADATSASGGMTLNIGGLVTGNTGVWAKTAGTGAMTVNVTAPNSFSQGDIGRVLAEGGPALDLDPGRNLTISLGAGALVAADGGAEAVIDVVSSTTSLTMTALGTLRSNDTAVSGHDDLILRVGGGAGTATLTLGANEIPGLCITFFGCPPAPPLPGSPAVGADIRGRFELGNTGATTLNLAGTTVWQASGATLLGEGATTLTHSVDAVIAASNGGGETEFDFGAGGNSYDQTGRLAVGGGTEAPATLRLMHLGTWNLSGRVLFGADADYDETDGVANDLIEMDVVSVLGLPGARLEMDADFSASQSSCETPTAADCLVLAGGNVFGSIPILVNDVSDGVSGFSDGGLLLVDVTGGVSDRERFVLDPATADYTVDPTLGAILDRGLYFYALSYDESVQQHFLVGMPKQQTLQLSSLGHIAQANWRMNTAGWFDRQADLRGPLAGREDGSGPGVWLRAVGGGIDRTIDQTGLHYTYTALSGYDEQSVGVIGGLDLATFAGEGLSYVFGVTGGYLESETTFKSSLTESTLKGHTLGAYAGYASGPFFVDAAVNGAWMDVDYLAPGWVLAGTSEAAGKLDSLGGQVEAGYRFAVSEGGAYVEPLAALSYVTTDITDFTLPGGTLEADDITSFRGSLGARISGDLAFDALTLKMGLIGRKWEEFEGENRVIATGSAGPVLLVDDVSGGFNEIGLDLGLFSNGTWSSLSVMLNAGIEFADAYKNSTGSLGFRYQW